MHAILPQAEQTTPDDPVGLAIGIVLGGPLLFVIIYSVMGVVGVSKFKAALGSGILTVIACYVIVAVAPHVTF